jgi:hypothetical protein
MKEVVAAVFMHLAHLGRGVIALRKSYSPLHFNSLTFPTRKTDLRHEKCIRQQIDITDLTGVRGKRERERKREGEREREREREREKERERERECDLLSRSHNQTISSSFFPSHHQGYDFAGKKSRLITGVNASSTRVVENRVARRHNRFNCSFLIVLAWPLV